MRSRRAYLAFWLCLPALACGFGCPPPGWPNGDEPERPPPPSEPPRTLQEIIETVELNAALVDRVVSSGNVQVTAHFTDENDQAHTYNLHGRLFFEKPRNFRLDLSPGLGDQVMQIGSNDEDYWLWVEPELRGMWWGRHRHSGKPCVDRMMIRPDQLIATLGVSGLPKATEDLFGPARKYGKNHDILYYLRLHPGGKFYIEREYWVSRSPPYQVVGVKTRDRFGRISMSALIDDYWPVWEAGPMIPRVINIIWPLDGGKFTMKMDGLRGYPEVKQGSFDRPSGDRLPGAVGENVVQIDRDCDR